MDLPADPPAPDLTATATARLEALRELHRLGLSLQAAQGPAISRAQFERRSLRLVRLLPERARASVGAVMPAGVHEVWVACGSAGRRHEVGREFGLLLPGDGSAPVLVRCVLVGVELETGERSDSIPAGHRTSCCLRFLGQAPDRLRSLPSASASAGGVPLWLGTEADGRKLQAQEDAGTRASAV